MFFFFKDKDLTEMRQKTRITPSEAREIYHTLLDERQSREMASRLIGSVAIGRVKWSEMRKCASLSSQRDFLAVRVERKLFYDRDRIISFIEGRCFQEKHIRKIRTSNN